MRLVYRIVLHMSWALSLLLAGWAVLFYLTMIDEINDEVDDSLENYAEMLVTRSLAGRELPAAYSGSNNGYYLHDVSAEYAEGRQHMVFSDEEIFIPEKDEEEPARVLRTIFRDSGGRYKELTVMTPTIEKDDLQEAILWWIVYLYLFLLLAILLVNVLVLHRTLRPLYALLRWFDSYTVGGKNAPLVNDTKVVEFRRLNEAANRYAERAESLFERQKQFIGNASHEMQTPLAICRNRAGDARGRRFGVDRGAARRNTEGAGDAGLPRAAQPLAAAAFEDRERTIPRDGTGRLQRPGAAYGRGYGGDLRRARNAFRTA